ETDQRILGRYAVADLDEDICDLYVADVAQIGNGDLHDSSPVNLERHRIALLGIDAELPNRLHDGLALHAPFVSERLQRSDDDRMLVHLEELPQCLAPVASAVAIRAERDVAAGHPLANLIRHRLHVVRRGDERTLAIGEALRDVARARLLERMELIPPLDRERLAPELAEARDAPDVRVDVEPLVEDLRGRLDLA